MKIFFYLLPIVVFWGSFTQATNNKKKDKSGGFFPSFNKKNKKKNLSIKDQAKSTMTKMGKLTNQLSIFLEELTNETNKNGKSQLSNNIVTITEHVKYIAGEVKKNISPEEEIELINNIKKTAKDLSIITASLVEEIDEKGQITIVKNCKYLIKNIGNMLEEIKKQPQSKDGKWTIVKDCEIITSTVANLVTALGKEIKGSKSIQVMKDIQETTSHLNQITATLNKMVDNNSPVIKEMVCKINNLLNLFSQEIDPNGRISLMEDTKGILHQINSISQKVDQETQVILNQFKVISSMLVSEIEDKGTMVKGLLNDVEQAINNLKLVSNSIAQVDKEGQIKLIENFQQITQSAKNLSSALEQELIEKGEEGITIIQDFKKITQGIAEIVDTASVAPLIENSKAIMHNIAVLTTGLSNYVDQEGNLPIVTNMHNLVYKTDNILNQIEKKTKSCESILKNAYTISSALATQDNDGNNLLVKRLTETTENLNDITKKINNILKKMGASNSEGETTTLQSANKLLKSSEAAVENMSHVAVKTGNELNILIKNLDKRSKTVESILIDTANTIRIAIMAITCLAVTKAVQLLFKMSNRKKMPKSKK